MSRMSTKATDRVELRAPPGRTERWRRAAERAGVSLSDWARRRLDRVADEELCNDEEGPPSEAGIEIALSAYGALGKERGEELRARVHAARKTPWRGRS